MGTFGLKTTLPRYLADEQQRIEEIARNCGLDFFRTVFEVLPYDQMNEVASYGGFPTRYPHWRFGMEYEQMSKSAEYGLAKIYEMVINNNPSIAYLLEGNSLVDQKLVMAHVYGHVDFFKNNFAFALTNQGTDPRDGEPIRKWIDTLANHGAVVRKWVNRVGLEKVEEFIDHCLSLENLIDPRNPQLVRRAAVSAFEETEETPEPVPLLPVNRDYMESFINPEDFVAAQKERHASQKDEPRRVPEDPTRDVLGFLINHAPLERWERDVLGIIRSEAYYFYPQMQTKIMNEGWASYWHSVMMTEKICTTAEIIEYAERNAGVMASSGTQLNPYKLGVELFRHVEERWNKGQFGKEWEECDDLAARAHWDRRVGGGREKIFQVRALYTDLTFIDEFLTPDFVRDQKLFGFGYNPRNERFEIETRKFEEVKNQLLSQLTNAGQPFIAVVDSNHGNRGELLLQHDHQGIDLRLDYAREVLTSLHRIWHRPVELHTALESRPTLLRFDGSDHVQQAL